MTNSKSHLMEKRHKKVVRMANSKCHLIEKYHKKVCPNDKFEKSFDGEAS